MKAETFANLKKGDVIRHKQAANAMTVVEIVGPDVILVRHTTASNPSEWLLIGDDGHAVYDEAE